MSEAIEHAKESIEHAHHAHAAEGSNAARFIAVLIAVLAAALAIVDMGAKSSQNAYLTHHIALSNDYSFFQAKNARATIRSTEASLLESLPNAPGNDAIAARIKAARAAEARLRDEPGGDGMKQLMEKAEEDKVLRAAAEHQYHAFEFAVGLLQISIVLASVAVVTRMNLMALGAGLLGGGAALYALLTALHVV
jgi:hypothetical protein